MFEEGTSGGTAQGAGSQVPDAGAAGQVGVDGGGAPQEPMVKVGDREVPMSQVETALKNDEVFTQRQQDIAARQRQVEEQELAFGTLGALLPALTDPTTVAKLQEAAPELAAALPSPEALANNQLRAENMRLRFDSFAASHPELKPEQLAGVRSEMVNLARQQRFAEAQDFETIALRLYRDDIVNAQVAQRTQQAQQQQQQQQLQQRNAGGLPPGVPTLPAGVDPNKLSPAAKMALGHQRNQTRP